MRRLAAGVTGLLLVIGAAGPALAACAGWSASALDRHACCAHLGTLASEGSVTDCCALAEQSSGPAVRDGQISPPLRPPTVLAITVPLIHSYRAPAACVVDRMPVEVSSPPRYVLLASLLI
jgi:hypothetical protein